MDSRCDQSSSTGRHLPQRNQSHSSISGEKMNSMAAGRLSLDNSFLNSGQTCINNNFDLDNRTSQSLLIDANPFYNQQIYPQSRPDASNFIHSGSYQQYKLEECSPYSRPEQIIKQELMDPSIQKLLPSDYSPYSNTNNLNPSLYLSDNSRNPSVNMSQLDSASPQSHSTTSSNFLQPTLCSSPSHQSPSLNQTNFQSSPNRSRNNSLLGSRLSLGANFHEQTMMLPQFQGHRRTPSEYSDVSASSAQHSPNTCHLDLSEQLRSPMQSSLDPSSYQDVLGIGNFSLSESQVQHELSPAHSPVLSPRPGLQISSIGPFISGLENRSNHTDSMFCEELFPPLNNDTRQSQQLVPPEINVEFAPAPRQLGFDPVRSPQIDKDALIPPDKVSSGRRRAFTDTTNTNSHTTSRPHSSVGVSPRRASDLSEVHSSNLERSLSPNHGTRAGSPNRPRRQSTPSIPNRDYILNLADPEYPAESGNQRRVQKHPANFQCSLCPKKFTRAYNLRSHLRTHTDERPFICSTCNKAFARQHDKKRHEGLHSGEKKFICKGDLKPTGHWGCGRRFARADALGRHFRSEAGRVCIHPLLEEEARERQRAWSERQMQNEQQQLQNMFNLQTPIYMDANNLSSNFMLPAALLAQYPALATLSWAALPHGDVGPEDDPSGRSSFDASGSEYYDDGDEGGYISSGPATQQYIQLGSNEIFR